MTPLPIADATALSKPALARSRSFSATASRIVRSILPEGESSVSSVAEYSLPPAARTLSQADRKSTVERLILA